jgi:hypothetical protein
MFDEIFTRARNSGAALVAQDHMTALHHRDTGGGLRWNAIGQFAPNPEFGMHPANVMQIPPMTGPGGYTSPPNQNTPASAIPKRTSRLAQCTAPSPLIENGPQMAG